MLVGQPLARPVARTVVDDDDLEACGIRRLPIEPSQGAPQLLAAIEGGDDDAHQHGGVRVTTNIGGNQGARRYSCMRKKLVACAAPRMAEVARSENFTAQGVFGTPLNLSLG